MLNCFGKPVVQLTHAQLRAELAKHEDRSVITDAKEWYTIRLSCYPAASVIDPQNGLLESLIAIGGEEAVQTARVAAIC